jgi:hypothetical protein
MKLGDRKQETGNRNRAGKPENEEAVLIAPFPGPFPVSCFLFPASQFRPEGAVSL